MNLFWRRFVESWVFVILLLTLLAGCPPQRTDSVLTPEPMRAEGLEAFPTPRTFSPPGHVFRVDAQGRMWPVTTLPVKPRRGDEVIPRVEGTKTLAVEQVLDLAGVGRVALPISGGIKASDARPFTLEAVSARRFYLEDGDIDPALREWAEKTNKGVVIRPEDSYYLIRETIQTDNLSYTSSRNWLVDVGIDEKAFKQLISGKSNVRLESTNGISINQKFVPPMFVWFKAERITVSRPAGVGPQVDVRRTPVGPAELKITGDGGK